MSLVSFAVPQSTSAQDDVQPAQHSSSVTELEVILLATRWCHVRGLVDVRGPTDCQALPAQLRRPVYADIFQPGRERSEGPFDAFCLNSSPFCYFKVPWTAALQRRPLPEASCLDSGNQTGSAAKNPSNST